MNERATIQTHTDQQRNKLVTAISWRLAGTNITFIRSDVLQVYVTISTVNASGFPLKCRDKRSGLFLDFSVLDIQKKSGPTLVSFRALNNKVDSNNCNIWAQDADEHTRHINCSTCNIVSILTKLLHWCIAILNWFFRTIVTKNQHFLGPMSKFRTFQGLIFLSSFFMTFQDLWEPWRVVSSGNNLPDNADFSSLTIFMRTVKLADLSDYFRCFW